MSELNLKQTELTYTACGTCTKHCERIKEFKETGNIKHLYRHEFEKACFAHNALYYDSKNLAKLTILDKILIDRAYEIARICKNDGHQRALGSMVYQYFDKKSGVSVSEQLAEELHKPIN